MILEKVLVFWHEAVNMIKTGADVSDSCAAYLQCI